MENSQRFYEIKVKGSDDVIFCPSVTTIGADVCTDSKSRRLMAWAKNMMEIYLVERLKDTFPNLVTKVSLKEWTNEIRFKVMSKFIKRQIGVGKKESTRISDKAKGVGSEVHNIIEKYISSKDKKKFIEWADKALTGEVANSFNAFLKWEKENVDAWLVSELVVFYNTSFAQAAGRFDALVLLKSKKNVKKDKIAIIDFKTSKGIYPEMAEQLGGYFALYNFSKKKEYYVDIKNENYTREFSVPNFEVNCGVILRIDKATGKFEVRNYTKKELELGAGIFMSSAHIFNKRDKMKMFEKKYKENMKVKKIKEKKKLNREKEREKKMAKLKKGEERVKKYTEKIKAQAT